MTLHTRESIDQIKRGTGTTPMPAGLRAAFDKLYPEGSPYRVFEERAIEWALTWLDGHDHAAPVSVPEHVMEPLQRLIENGASLGSASAEDALVVARWVRAQNTAPVSVPDPIHGDVLPPVGSTVWILHGRDDNAHACVVTGYYAWPDLGGDKSLHRVFVRLNYCGTTTPNARMLCDVWTTEEAALAASTQPTPAPTVTDNDGTPLDREHQHALREAAHNAASDEYFKARPQIDGMDRSRVFQSGFERGYDAAGADLGALRDDVERLIEHGARMGVALRDDDYNMATESWRALPNHLQAGMNGREEALDAASAAEREKS